MAKYKKRITDIMLGVEQAVARVNNPHKMISTNIYSVT